MAPFFAAGTPFFPFHPVLTYCHPIGLSRLYNYSMTIDYLIRCRIRILVEQLLIRVPLIGLVILYGVNSLADFLASSTFILR